MATPEQVYNDFLSLSSTEKEKVANQILLNFKADTDEKIDKLWAEEAKSRSKALENGEITSRPAEEMFKDFYENKGFFSR